jgi:hypothetical protein
MRILIALLASTLMLTGASAAQLAAPSGKVILEVTGKIANTNYGKTAEFDMSMLDALLPGTTTTSTPWYDGERTFSGPLGFSLLEAVGASGTMMKVTAINDYTTEVPVADFESYRVLLATRLDGEPMSVRDKGPIFIIYPFDDQPDLNNETYYGRSAWQVKSIEIY